MARWDLAATAMQLDLSLARSNAHLADALARRETRRARRPVPPPLRLDTAQPSERRDAA